MSCCKNQTVFVKVASLFIKESHGTGTGSRNGPQAVPDNTRAKCALVIMKTGKGEKMLRRRTATKDDGRVHSPLETSGRQANMSYIPHAAADSPPASGRQLLGVHPAHVSHANQSHDKIFHPGRDGAGCRRSHCVCCFAGALARDGASHPGQSAAPRRFIARPESGIADQAGGWSRASSLLGTRPEMAREKKAGRGVGAVEVGFLCSRAYITGCSPRPVGLGLS